ncbi:MAG: archaemetzincin family Zn-dependent metalloprotease [Nitrososphaeraceae archaeon]
MLPISKTNKLHINKEIRNQDIVTAASLSHFYPTLIKQLLKTFNGVVTAIGVTNSLMLDESSTTNLYLFNKSRNQWISERVLEWILREAISGSSHTKILALCDFDAYSNGLNFVFGQAHTGGRIGAIYLPRLRQEFYGLESDVNLFHQRVTTEAVHELGHMFRLSHCERRSCVMHFSNSLHDTDFKHFTFCNRCAVLLWSTY